MNNYVKELIKINIEQQLSGVPTLALNLAGKPGIGKTTTVTKIAKDLGLELLVISIPSHGVEYFSGLPMFVDNERMAKYSTTASNSVKSTEWTVPELIHTANTLAESNDKGVVILLDDFHMADTTIQQHMFNLLLAKTMGQFKLHEKVAIIAAQNDTKSAGMRQMLTPIKDRFAMVNVNFDRDVWLRDCGVNMHHYVTTFFKGGNDEFLQEAEVPGLGSSGTPRSWDYFSKMLSNTNTEKFVFDNLENISKQYMSADAAIQFKKHVAYTQVVDLGAVIKKKVVIDLGEKTVIDHIIWGSIMSYVHKVDDATFVLKMLQKNLHCSAFIGFVAQDLVMREQSAGFVNIAQQAVYDTVVGEDTKGLTAVEQKKVSSIKLDKEALIEVMSQYLV